MDTWTVQWYLPCCALAPVCTPAKLLSWSTQEHNPNGISISSASFCTAHGRVSFGMPWHGFPLKIASSHSAIWTPCNKWFFGPVRILNPNAISVQPFLHNSWQSFPILHDGRPIPLKIAPSRVGSGPLSSTWLLGLGLSEPTTQTASGQLIYLDYAFNYLLVF